MNELMSAISLGFLAWLLLGLYNELRVDKVRSELFALRDRLFDEANAGGISFESRAYGATRMVLNGAIRFAHKISFSRMIALRLLVRRDRLTDAADDLTLAMNSSSERDRTQCKAYLREADLIIIRYVLSSPLVLVWVAPHVLMSVAAQVGHSVAEAAAKKFARETAAFNRIAYREGRLANDM